MKKTHILICLLSVFCLCGCSSKKETVTLTLWGADNSQELLREISDEFINAHKSEADITINIGIEPESSIAGTVEKNPEALSDVFIFADDQLKRMLDKGKLAPVTEDLEAVIEENGGKDSQNILSASEDGVLYAYPLTASNGYFLYYNSDYFTEEDVKSLDRMLEVAKKAGKKVAMDWSSGWYIFSFFQGAGLTLNQSADGTTNECNWNAKDTRYTGVSVAEAMLKISSQEAFLSCQSDELYEGVESGEIIACVNGTWSSSVISKAYGKGYSAAKLPTYTLEGEQVQMGSFVGFKLVGVNPSSENKDWAMKLARFISNEENQVKRFRTLGEGPSNINAAKLDEVKASVAINALVVQTPYAVTQRVAEPYWIAATVFGTVMASGNPDNKDLQKLLDDLVHDSCQKNEKSGW